MIPQSSFDLKFQRPALPPSVAKRCRCRIRHERGRAAAALARQRGSMQLGGGMGDEGVFMNCTQLRFFTYRINAILWVSVYKEASLKKVIDSFVHQV